MSPEKYEKNTKKVRPKNRPNPKYGKSTIKVQIKYKSTQKVQNK